LTVLSLSALVKTTSPDFYQGKRPCHWCSCVSQDLHHGHCLYIPTDSNYLLPLWCICSHS
jgi:hypothetical protein